jgi:digeranylgeranylglycerophospholipid reductase
VLIEQRTRIGEHIVCAEGIGAAGISELLNMEDQWIASRVDVARLIAPDGTCTDLQDPGCGYIVHKDALLRSIGAMAAGEGTEIRLGSQVVGLEHLDGQGIALDVSGPTGPYRVTCKAVIGADGLNSLTGRLAGIHRGLSPDRVFACAQYTVAPIDVDPRVVEFHFGSGIAPSGYGWVFPKGDSIANVGVGVAIDKSRDLTTTDYLNRLCQKRCPRARPLAFVVGGVPSLKEPYRSFDQGVFLAGDAAGVADPISGEGIVPALKSAGIAAKAACLSATADHGGAEKTFAGELKAAFKDRKLRFAVRKVLTGMNDDDLAAMIKLVGRYAQDAGTIRSHPVRLAGFLVKAMPKSFGLIKHLVGK